ncbi:MAG: hypothetical protein GY904_31480 [Planctomycetaceae bacterium]|nr:hypothetical protein [Planctomycetaceae bacterium]
MVSSPSPMLLVATWRVYTDDGAAIANHRGAYKAKGEDLKTQVATIGDFLASLEDSARHLPKRH